MNFTLPQLDYSYNDLEPFFDAQTMEIHHSKHHNAYVSNLNKALTDLNENEQDLNKICFNINLYPLSIRNNAGGHYNHSFFWKLIKPKGSKIPLSKTLELINKEFENFENFKNQFNTAAISRFGSGWTWLILDDNNKLVVISTPNQDNPLMNISEITGKPIIALDVWEHAYYLKYQNKRADYIDAFWSIINWDVVEQNLNF
jgi:superoxide dismutase, Fe-Mn family